MMFRAIAVTAALACGPVAAATYNYDVSFPTSGSPNPATFNFDIDFDLITIGGSTAGVTLNSANFALGGALLGKLAGPLLTIGTAAGGTSIDSVNSTTDDILLILLNPQTTATPIALTFSQAGQNGNQAQGTAGLSVTSSLVLPPSAVPLPASMPLLGAALAGLAFWRRRKAA